MRMACGSDKRKQEDTTNPEIYHLLISEMEHPVHGHAVFYTQDETPVRAEDLVGKTIVIDDVARIKAPTAEEEEEDFSESMKDLYNRIPELQEKMKASTGIASADDFSKAALDLRAKARALV